MAENPAKKSAAERAFEKMDLRAELDALERRLFELKIQYEQYFSGILPLAPDQIHQEVKRMMRKLLKAPFKNSAMNYRLRSLEGRYHTFNTYWQRVLKQREEGTYVRDVFKANLREKIAYEEERSQTAVGAAERGMQGLFNSYKNALEQSSGKKMKIDFETFQKSLIQRAKDFKDKHGAKKLTFKVVVKNGKVTVQAQAKKE
jgi:Arc/MetJ family transcription regulator